MGLVANAIRLAGKRALVGKPLPRDRIAAAAEQLGCNFPPSLHDFLAEFGWAIVGGWEINGLSGRGRSVNEERLVVASQFASSRCGVPLVCLCDDGGECIFALAIRDGMAVDCIEVWDVHTREMEEGWPSGLTFAAFVRDISSDRRGVDSAGSGELSA